MKILANLEIQNRIWCDRKKMKLKNVKDENY